MRTFLFVCACALSLAGRVYGDEALQQAYKEFVQIDAQIEALVKQKLQLKAEIAQHMQREEMSPRPRVERRQNEQIDALSQQMQSLSQQLSALEGKRSSILLSLE